jgi:catechol 2,3-dioxygenase-like lactoylglutathione lyase family enzyme
MINDAPACSIRSVVISVRDLDRSTTFYQDVMNVSEVIRQDKLAVLGGEVTGPFTLFLRQANRNAIRVGQEALGIRALSCDVEAFAELDRVEGRLRAFNAFRDRQFLDEAEEFEIVRGYDPDRLPLSFVAYETRNRIALNDYHRALAGMYTVDL